MSDKVNAVTLARDLLDVASDFSEELRNLLAILALRGGDVKIIKEVSQEAIFQMSKGLRDQTLATQMLGQADRFQGPDAFDDAIKVLRRMATLGSDTSLNHHYEEVVNTPYTESPMQYGPALREGDQRRPDRHVTRHCLAGDSTSI
ncbi:hypothetical protein LTR70_004532 [Exophiala xenobiotica]|uniref:Uncharacterized protein n=1 Tax=Lithohypha guttulata TaxID=1690604 RepID=A0ABR0KNV7_9EURO|nr:hypothetical protein LTR24_000462 [Lithohypha guttulata]KAK5320449.1 hypothetical protein LTR70_004532 [Exophiala xenobiotica]